MREFKFRAWNGERFHHFDINSMERFPVKDIQQHTGLEDMDGDPIYEGDILYNPTNDYYYEVIWDDTCAQFVFNCPKKPYADGYFDLDEEGEWSYLMVWGNRCEHPHLLERSMPNGKS